MRAGWSTKHGEHWFCRLPVLFGIQLAEDRKFLYGQHPDIERNIRTRAIKKTSLRMLMEDFSVKPVFQVDRYHLEFVLSYHRSGEKGKGSADLEGRVNVMKFADQSGRGGGTEKSKGLCLGKCPALWPTFSCFCIVFFIVSLCI